MKNIAIILIAALTVSCNNTDPAKNATSPVEKKADTPESTGSSSGGTKITVELTGGPNAGKYSASSDEPTCSMGYTGANSFGNQYSVDGKGDKELSSLQLVVNDYDSAKAGTDQFMVTVGFGKLTGGNSYTISGGSSGTKKGSGKLIIKESGSEKTVTIEGKTDDGVAISATIVCASTVGAPAQ